MKADTPSGPLTALLRLPRLGRIIIVSFITLLAAFSLSYLTADLHWRFFFSLDTLALPWVITVAATIILYIVGWLLVIGMAGSTPTPRRVLRWYIASIAVILLAGLIWMLVNALPALLD